MGKFLKRGPRGCLKAGGCGCGCLVVLILGLIVAVYFLLNRVPGSYQEKESPLAPPTVPGSLGGGLDGFDSPYLGHTGSWDGKGGAMFGKPKIADLEAEAAMGLRWTFMSVYWRALEPEGPVDPAREVPPAWQALDAFVLEAHKRKLNILMQAPVVGGNAGGPPKWAGRREKGKSAPGNMDAAAAFAGKLAARYAPGGTLAAREGWGQAYGVRAWELDNEPNFYLTHWKDQAADYAEFVTKAARAIREADPQAVIVGPGANINAKALDWIAAALDGPSLRGSPEFKHSGEAYSIGPVLDVVSFHLYEGLDSALSGEDRTIERVFGEVYEVFKTWESRAPGFSYPARTEFWHTEGNFDFLGVLSRERRAAWRVQFLTRAFAAGVRKAMVMDASPREQAAVRAYVSALPNPFPMHRADKQVKVVRGAPAVFKHLDDLNSGGGAVWVCWAAAGAGDAEIELPVQTSRIRAVQIDGTKTEIPAREGRVAVYLQGDKKMAPPLLLIDRP